jgi:hypothetical protein
MIGAHLMQKGYPEAGLKKAALCGVVMAVGEIGTDGRRGLRISQRPSRTSRKSRLSSELLILRLRLGLGSLSPVSVSPSLVTPPLVTLHSARVMNTLKNG